VTIRDWVAPSVGGLDLLRSPSRSTPWKGLQRLTLSGDSVEAVQPDELQGTVRPCRRNGRPSCKHSDATRMPGTSSSGLGQPLRGSVCCGLT
jgi:hypothetical protein